MKYLHIKHLETQSGHYWLIKCCKKGYLQTRLETGVIPPNTELETIDVIYENGNFTCLAIFKNRDRLKISPIEWGITPEEAVRRTRLPIDYFYKELWIELAGALEMSYSQDALKKVFEAQAKLEAAEEDYRQIVLSLGAEIHETNDNSIQGACLLIPGIPFQF